MSSSSHCLLTSHLGLDLPMCLLLSRFPTEMCVFSISPVRFPCPICPTVFQFTSHQHSLTSTNNAAAHCAILFVPLLIPLFSEQITPSASVLTQYSRVYSLEHVYTCTEGSESVHVHHQVHHTRARENIHSLVFSLEPEPSHVTGMALAHCNLGKILGVVCHYFPPAFRCFHFSRQVLPSTTAREILAAKGGTVGEKDIR